MDGENVSRLSRFAAWFLAGYLLACLWVKASALLLVLLWLTRVPPDWPVLFLVHSVPGLLAWGLLAWLGWRRTMGDLSRRAVAAVPLLMLASLACLLSCGFVTRRWSGRDLAVLRSLTSDLRHDDSGDDLLDLTLGTEGALAGPYLLDICVDSLDRSGPLQFKHCRTHDLRLQAGSSRRTFTVSESQLRESLPGLSILDGPAPAGMPRGEARVSCTIRHKAPRTLFSRLPLFDPTLYLMLGLDNEFTSSLSAEGLNYVVLPREALESDSPGP